MRELQERQRNILEKGIEDFINTGEPITSQRLYERFDFGVKTAMLRRELHDLSNEGYLYQEHPSGGRFPTNKAYKIFIDRLLEEDLATKNVMSTCIRMMDLLHSDSIDEFAKDMSEYLKVLSAVYDSRDNSFFDFGLSMLFDQVDMDERKELGRIMRDIEELPYRLKERGNEWGDDSGSDLHVYVGENPLTRSSHLSCMIRSLKIDEGEFFILAIGPRRMNYKRSLGVLRTLNKENK